MTRTLPAGSMLPTVTAVVRRTANLHKGCSGNPCALVANSAGNTGDSCLSVGQSCAANTCTNRPAGISCNDANITGGIYATNGNCRCTANSQSTQGMLGQSLRAGSEFCGKYRRQLPECGPKLYG